MRLPCCPLDWCSIQNARNPLFRLFSTLTALRDKTGYANAGHFLAGQPVITEAVS